MRVHKIKLRQGISHILSVIFLVVVTILGVGLGLQYGGLSKDVIMSQVQESNYYSEVHNEVYMNAEEILWSSLSKESTLEDEINAILEGVISLERVYISSREYMEQTLSHSEVVTIDTSRIVDELRSNIYGYMEVHDIVLNRELEEGITELVTRIEKEYIRGIQFQFISYIAIYQRSFTQYMKFIVIISVSVMILILVVLLLMSKYKHRAIRSISYSMVASSFLILIGSGSLLLTKQYERHSLTPYYYRIFIEGYIKQSIVTVLVIGIIYATISIALIILGNYMKKHRGTK